MSKHTPLPWKAGELETSDGEIYIWTDAEDKFIASVKDEDDDGQDTLANAEFIVRACNCHEELLAACKAVAAALDRIQQDGTIVWLHGDDCPVHESASERLAWVIDKAEDKSDATPGATETNPGFLFLDGPHSDANARSDLGLEGKSDA